MENQDDGGEEEREGGRKFLNEIQFAVKMKERSFATS